MWPPNEILFPIDFSERSVSADRYVRTLGCRFRPEIEPMSYYAQHSTRTIRPDVVGNSPKPARYCGGVTSSDHRPSLSTKISTSLQPPLRFLPLFSQWQPRRTYS
jgi:hypothetical protein